MSTDMESDTQMSTEADSPRRAAFTISEFCQAYRISRSKLYQLFHAGTGPRVMRVGTKILISDEAATDWRREREAQQLSKPAAA